MSYILLLTAQTAPAGEASGTDILLLCVVGLLVVFSALGIIGGLMYLLSRVTARFEDRTPAPVEQRVASASGAVDPRTLALITAAAYAAVGAPVRVRRVTFVNENNASVWKETGRIAVHSSHKLGRHSL